MSDDAVHNLDGTGPFRFDSWEYRDPARGEHFRRCDYCGSIDPRDLAVEIERGLPRPPEWADRKYGWPHKVYLDIANQRPDSMFVLGGLTVGKGREHTPAPDEVAWADLTPEQREIVNRDGWGHDDDSHLDYVRFGTRDVHHAKFYSRHLAPHAELTDEVKATVERAIGLRFTFDGSRVGWAPAS